MYWLLSGPGPGPPLPPPPFFSGQGLFVYRKPSIKNKKKRLNLKLRIIKNILYTNENFYAFSYLITFYAQNIFDIKC